MKSYGVWHVRYGVVAVAAGAALLLASCSSSAGDQGGNAGESSSGSATSAAVGSTAAGSPIHIAVLADESSALDSWSKELEPVVKAWASYTNSHGGINGHPVDVANYDTKGDVPTAVSDANRLVGDSSIAGVVLGDVSTELQAAPILSKAKLPVIGGVGYTPQVWGGPAGMGLPYVYGVATTFPDFTKAAVGAAKTEGAKVWAAALCTESPACASTGQILNSAVTADGLTNTGTVGAPNDAPNYDAQCLQIIQRKADVIAMQLQGPAAVRVAQDCKTQGYTGLIDVGMSTAYADVYNKIDNVIGAINGFPWYVDAAPVVQYRTVMQDGGVSEDTWSNATATATYASVEMFKKALAYVSTKAGVTRADVVAAYAQVKDETLGGLVPMPLSYSAGGKPMPITCYWVYAKKNGNLTGSFTPQCVK